MKASEFVTFVKGTLGLAKDWAEDQLIELTDGEICISAMRDIRRKVNEVEPDLLQVVNRDDLVEGKTYIMVWIHNNQPWSCTVKLGMKGDILEYVETAGGWKWVGFNFDCMVSDVEFTFYGFSDL